jgi:hypothetical protein
LSFFEDTFFFCVFLFFPHFFFEKVSEILMDTYITILTGEREVDEDEDGGSDRKKKKTLSDRKKVVCTHGCGRLFLSQSGRIDRGCPKNPEPCETASRRVPRKD